MDNFVPLRKDILCVEVFDKKDNFNEEDLHILAVMAINSIVNIYNMCVCKRRQ